MKTFKLVLLLAIAPACLMHGISITDFNTAYTAQSVPDSLPFTFAALTLLGGVIALARCVPSLAPRTARVKRKKCARDC